MHLVRKNGLVAKVARLGLARRALAGFRRLRGSAKARRKQMRVVETLKMGSNRRLMLVSYSGERFLVGMGSGGVETIVRVRGEEGESL